MSGPTTAILVEDPVAVLLSAAGIRAAMAIREGYQHSAELEQRHKTEQANQLAQQQQAIRQGQLAQQQQLEQAEAEFSQLLVLGQRLGQAERIQNGRPVTEKSDIGSAVRALQTYNTELKTIMLTEFGKLPDLDNALPDFSANAQAPVEERLVARIRHLGALPDPIQNLLHQLAQDSSSQQPAQRRELLHNELRRQVQLHLEQSQAHAVQQASALILRHTLTELGYQVQEFSDTLFIDGGVVHFRRHEWGNHMVRLRVNQKSHSVNFNVIRAVQAADNALSVLDHIAEDRWCAEFPTLLKAIEARGLGLEVTRRLDAGALPVQLVERSQLPSFPEIEARRTDDAPLKQRNLTDT